MREETKNIIKVASVYMATIIGAGFASGQEIMQFFSTYYEGGFYGIVLAGVLFSAIGAVVLNKIYKNRIGSFNEFLIPITGNFLGRVIQIIISLFMFSVFSVMVAGMGSIVEQNLGLPFKYGIVLTSLLCLCILLNDIKGVAVLTTLVTPILVAGIFIVGLYLLISKYTDVFNIVGYIDKATNNWFFSALIYVSYNSILSIVIMCSLGPYLKTRKTGIAGGVAGGIVLASIAFILNAVIFIFYPDGASDDLPILGILSKYSGLLTSIYTFVLWLAMLVTAVTSGFCLIERVRCIIPINKKLLTVSSCIVIIPLSAIGFSSLISSVYPVFGYLGLLIISMVFFRKIAMQYLILFKKKRN